ncbi:hypothetical protein R5K32_15275 [Acinetobacter baumannii]|uniref:hypothetical protein n=1 Tax=Acinetobacter baumannii TaxID=470 RepID=UPI0022362B60|nr:hypothetical protein [Acinetobacter baumannii]MDW2811498.1 hypothetical protein [Acinetobacter baumannii]UZG64178.1 hypothetical protein OMP06_19455 [Acinetobacter baumannii]
MIAKIHLHRNDFESLKPFLHGYEAVVHKDKAILHIDPDDLIIAREELRYQEREDFHSFCA